MEDNSAYEEESRRFAALLNANRDMIRRGCMRCAARGNFTVEDLFQEVSYALWMQFGKLRPDASPAVAKAWVWWRMRTVLYNIRRGLDVSLVPLDAVGDDELNAPSEADMQWVEDVLSLLDPDDQRLMGMVVDGYKAREIAEALSLRPEAVRKRLSRIRAKLRERIANDEN